MSKKNNKLERLTSTILLNSDMYKVPVNVVKIAKFNDIKVYEGMLDKKISGAIRYNKKDDAFEILVNKNDSRVRQRFTIAHELGHYFLHEEYLKNEELHVDTVMYRADKGKTDDENDREREVDYFAGALLMNETLLKRVRNENTISELAELFDVSISAMTVRLDILGIL